MRLPTPALGVLLVAGAVAVVGALFSLPWPLGAGWVVALAVLALHPLLARPVLPGPPRLLLGAGLLGLALAVLLQAWTFAAFRSAVDAATLAELVALDHDPGQYRAQTLRGLASAGCEVLACAAFAVALTKLRRPVPGPVRTGFATLAVVAVAMTGFAISAWATTPEPVMTVPADLPPELAAEVATVVPGQMMSLDPFGAVIIGVMLYATFQLIDGYARPPLLPSAG
ncbi:hypothetical protein Apa02nite_032430 [Actinoplanes palleronii]|uniref:Uncharacterized protein n=2 Tax=Actinoplanes palleronii TaxID=113570 RepID=A0ABQ4BA65_9ACTN|nr:hypothetical protein Apa02nite_032430 [Actinoplanes palleronii]